MGHGCDSYPRGELSSKTQEAHQGFRGCLGHQVSQHFSPLGGKQAHSIVLLFASFPATHHSPCSRLPRAATTRPSERSFFSVQELGALAGLMLRIYSLPPTSALGCWQDQCDSVGWHRAGNVSGGWEPSPLTTPGGAPLRTSWEPLPVSVGHASAVLQY